jgi:hypothetical protein
VNCGGDLRHLRGDGRVGSLLRLLADEGFHGRDFVLGLLLAESDREEVDDVGTSVAEAHLLGPPVLVSYQQEVQAEDRKAREERQPQRAANEWPLSLEERARRRVTERSHGWARDHGNVTRPTEAPGDHARGDVIDAPIVRGVAIRGRRGCKQH